MNLDIQVIERQTINIYTYNEHLFIYLAHLNSTVFIHKKCSEELDIKEHTQQKKEDNIPDSIQVT